MTQEQKPDEEILASICLRLVELVVWVNTIATENLKP